MGSFLLVLGKKKPKARNWKVKVEEAVGVFPSQRSSRTVPGFSTLFTDFVSLHSERLKLWMKAGCKVPEAVIRAHHTTLLNLCLKL